MFACNAKSFAIAFLFFLFFVFFLSAFEGTAKSFLANILRLVTMEACDQDFTHSFDTTKIFPLKMFLQLFFETCVAHKTAYSW